MPFFTMSPTSRISPMNDDTLSGVPVMSSSTDRADERQRRGEQYDQRLDERLELNDHHADHAAPRPARARAAARETPPAGPRTGRRALRECPRGGGFAASTLFTSFMNAPSERALDIRRHRRSSAADSRAAARTRVSAGWKVAIAPSGTDACGRR